MIGGSWSGVPIAEDPGRSDAEEFRGARDVVGRVAVAHVTEVRGQDGQARLNVNVGAMPLGDPLRGEAMTEVVRSQQELLNMFDTNLIGLRAALSKASDPHLQKPWSLVANGSALFTQPRYLIYRTLFLNHLVHHRAQLGVYFRLLGVKVPALYNDSADEKGGMFIE